MAELHRGDQSLVVRTVGFLWYSREILAGSPSRRNLHRREEGGAHMTSCVVIHYAEIALKGKNRAFFERTLQRNIRDQ